MAKKLNRKEWTQFFIVTKSGKRYATGFPMAFGIKATSTSMLKEFYIKILYTIQLEKIKFEDIIRVDLERKPM